MFKILFYLFLIRFRKWIAKGDYLATIFLYLAYLAPFFLFFVTYEKYKNYGVLFLLDITFKHLNREDINLLKLDKNYKIVLFTESFIYILPLLIVLFLKGEFIWLVSIIIFLPILINLPKINFKTIPYPFQLFNPFWHICFRKYKFIYALPLLSVLIYMAIIHNNENIIYFVFILLSLISFVPTFQRERFEEIKLTPLTPEKYFFCQCKNSIVNTIFLIIPIALLLCFLLKWNLLLFLFGVLLFPLINILLKYTFFTNSFLHQITFAFFIGLTLTMFGIPLLAIPYLYKKAIKNLNTIKYANH